MERGNLRYCLSRFCGTDYSNVSEFSDKYPKSFFIPVSEVYKNEWEIRYSGDGLRTVQEYKEAADES